jgi:hypothetical protein
MENKAPPPRPRMFTPGIVGAKPSAQKEKEEKDYPTTGNMTRDNMRKLFFETFKADQPVPGEKVS